MYIGNPIYPTSSISTPDVLSMRSNQIGSLAGGYPPFNSGAIPINLAFLLCCDAGTNDDFLSFLYPYFDGYGNYLQNKAVLGFTSGANTIHYRELTWAAFEKLIQGYSIKEARDRLVELAQSNGWQMEEPLGAGYVNYDETTALIHGDEFTNISNVYSTTGRMTTWYRVL